VKIVQARNYTRGRVKPIRRIVIHTMEAPEAAHTAAIVAKWFGGPKAPKASAHYCVDHDEVIRCVADADTAWHAPGANADGIGIELAGTARQTAAQWADMYSNGVLVQAAALVADLCEQHKIPIVRIGVDELRSGAAGICGHVDVSRAFGKSTHWDPGPNFPWDRFIDMVRERACVATVSVPVVPSGA
jgi:N-acetyl-anhydromuramyl-L-alanine amidase AmpD